MRIEDVAGLAFGHIFGRIFRRALLAVIITALAVVALYFFTLAGTMALETRYGALDARAIVGAIYACRRHRHRDRVGRVWKTRRL